MTENIQNLINDLIAQANQYPYIAAGIGLLYLILLYKKPKSIISITLLAVTGLVVGLWFKSMFESRNDTDKWKKYEKPRIEQIDKSAE